MSVRRPFVWQMTVLSPHIGLCFSREASCREKAYLGNDRATEAATEAVAEATTEAAAEAVTQEAAEAATEASVVDRSGDQGGGSHSKLEGRQEDVELTGPPGL